MLYSAWMHVIQALLKTRIILFHNDQMRTQMKVIKGTLRLLLTVVLISIEKRNYISL